MLNHLTTVRMTASRVAELFLTAKRIAAAELTERHLDMLQMVDDTDIGTRVRLGLAEDEIRAGAVGEAVAHCVKAFNARCGR